MPSVAVTGAGQLTIGLLAAVQVKLTITSVLFQPFEFGSGEAVAVMVGDTVSMFRVTLTDPLLSALSVAVPTTTWFAPCELTVTGPGQTEIPDKASEQINDTVTGVLFHPFAFGGGDVLAAMRGTVLSRFS
jgi:hypothetical protein